MVRDMTGYGIIDAMLEIHAYANIGDPFGNGFDLIDFSAPAMTGFRADGTPVMR
jgi:hypothetical protein